MLKVEQEGEMLQRPKWMHKETEPIMLECMQILYTVRVATLSQLSRFLQMNPNVLRKQLSRYGYIKGSKQSASGEKWIYEEGGWKRAPYITYYVLARKSAIEWEISKNLNACYQNSPRSNPTPEKSSLSRYVSLTELILMCYLNDVEIEWFPNIYFHKLIDDRGRELESSETEEYDNNGMIPVSCGAKIRNQLFGIGLYFSDNFKSFQNYIKRTFPIELHKRMQGVAFVKESVESQAILKSIDKYGYIHVIPFEWAVKNPIGLYYWLSGETKLVLAPILKEYERLGGVVEKIPQPHLTIPYGWKVTLPNGEVHYVDTTIGNPIAQMREFTRSDVAGKKMIYCATEAEKEVYEKLSQKNYTYINFYVLKRDDN